MSQEFVEDGPREFRSALLNMEARLADGISMATEVLAHAFMAETGCSIKNLDKKVTPTSTGFTIHFERKGIF